MKYRYGKSKAGHDKDKIYLIISEDERYYYLKDEHKATDTIKKKNKKHIQPIK